jgi:hypothetical protein
MFLEVEPYKLLIPHETSIAATMEAISEVYEIVVDGFYDRSGAGPSRCDAAPRQRKLTLSGRVFDQRRWHEKGRAR